MPSKTCGRSVSSEAGGFGCEESGVIIGFEWQFFEPGNGFPGHPPDADEMNNEDGKEERDAQDAQRPLPVLDENATKHRMLFGSGICRLDGFDLFGFSELLEISNERDDFAVRRHLGAR